MDEILKELKEGLAEHEEALNNFIRLAKEPDSWGGTEINWFEELAINNAKGLIEAIKQEIKDREAVLADRKRTEATITMQGVVNHYGLLYDKTVEYIMEQVDNTYLKWQDHILTAGSCYANASKTFNDTVEAQNQYKQALVDITGSVISVIGLGALSWLSTSLQAMKSLEKVSDKLINATEDMVQGGWDKVVGHAAGAVPSKVAHSNKLPTEFQNEITQKALNRYLKNRNIVLSYGKKVLHYNTVVVDLEAKKIGNAKEEYRTYNRIEDQFEHVKLACNEWVNTKPSEINETLLTEDFERCFWAGWLPRLQYTSKKTVPYVDEFGVRDPMGGTVISTSIEYSDSFSGALSSRLTHLIDLVAIGVGKNGLDYNVSDNDVKLLIAWAHKFQPSQKF